MIEKVKLLLNNRINIYNTFYKKCIEYIDNNIDKFIKTHEMKHNMILEPIRLYIEDNLDDYICFIADLSAFDTAHVEMLKKECIYRDLTKISKKAHDNLLRQLYVIESDNLDNFFESDVLTKYYSNIDNITFFIVEKTNPLIDSIIHNKSLIKNNNSLHLFMGSETLYFLEKQNLDRFINYMRSKDNYVIKSVNMFKQVYYLCKKLMKTPDIYNRIMFFSGMVLHTLGTSYTSDADLIFWDQNMGSDDFNKLKLIFDKYGISDVFIYNNSTMNNYYGYYISNPVKHYHFLGMKISCIDSYLARLYKRAAPSSFVDLVMLDRINDIQIKPCYPVITFENEPINVYTQKYTDMKLKITQKYFKEWHNINYSFDEIKKIIMPCKNYPSDPPFIREIKPIDITHNIELAIYQISRELINEYLISINNETSNLLIIDDATEYPGFYFKNRTDLNILVIEPIESKISNLFVKMTRKYIEKHKIDDHNRFNILKSDIMESNNMHLMRKFNFLIFRFNIYLYMSQINILINNINKCTTVDTLIIILYIDGKYLENLIKSSDRYEEKDNGVTMFGVYEYDDMIDEVTNTHYKQIVIYLKETIRYGSGRVELLLKTQDILDAFGSDYYLVKDDIIINEKYMIENNMSDQQKRISKIFKYMILKKR